MNLNVISINEKIQKSTILFMDYNGWWSDLNLLYYSNSSHILVSKHPESIIKEITSYYCSQCLDTYNETDVQIYRNRCSSCFQCPLCESPLSIVGLNLSNYCFQCRMCYWRSDGCNVIGEDEEDIITVALEKERDELTFEAFQALYSSYVNIPSQPSLPSLSEQSKIEFDGDHSNITTSTSNKTNSTTNNTNNTTSSRKSYNNSKSPENIDSDIGIGIGIGSIDIEDEMRTKLKQKRFTWDDMIKQESEKELLLSNSSSVNGFSNNDPRNESQVYKYMKSTNLYDQVTVNEDEENMFKTSLLSSFTSLSHRLNRQRHDISYFIDNLSPNRVPICYKYMLRCRKDVKENKMSILLQSRQHPLEGDSSYRFKGKWFIKDASAIHQLPHIKFQYLRNNTTQPNLMLIEVINYTENELNFKIEIENKENDIIESISNCENYNSNIKDVLKSYYNKNSHNSTILNLLLFNSFQETFDLSSYDEEIFYDDYLEINRITNSNSYSNTEQNSHILKNNILKLILPIHNLNLDLLNNNNSDNNDGENKITSSVELIMKIKCEEKNSNNNSHLVTFVRIVIPVNELN